MLLEKPPLDDKFHVAWDLIYHLYTANWQYIPLIYHLYTTYIAFQLKPSLFHCFFCASLTDSTMVDLSTFFSPQLLGNYLWVTFSKEPWPSKSKLLRIKGHETCTCQDNTHPLRIQICPEKGINPTIRGWDWTINPTLGRCLDSSGSLGTCKS